MSRLQTTHYKLQTQLTFPSFSQWKQIFKVLKKREQLTIATLLLTTICSLVFLVSSFYVSHTIITPTLGGTYIEAVVGQPRFINPIYGETNDIDRALIDLTFSGIVMYDNRGQIVKDLADNFTVSADGKTYNFTLKNNVFWHDGKPLTTDDVIFTIKTIQNSDYKSPLRANWIDVDAQKISDRSFALTLKSPYGSFLENCTIKILPKHIWEKVSPENFILSPYNLQPVGSGAFEFEGISQTDLGFISSLRLRSNRKYYNQPSFISKLEFRFFEKGEDLIRLANTGHISGFSLASFDSNESDTERKISQGFGNNTKFTPYSFSMPRYVALFFNNQKLSIFSDANVRKALSHATNKDSIIKKLNSETKNNVSVVSSPLLPDFFKYQKPSIQYAFDPDKAKSLLDKAGFKDNGSGQREKALVKKPAFQFKSYLKVGSKGSEVTQLQACFNRLTNDNLKDFLKDEANGIYGRGTEAAVTEFQKEYLPDAKPTGETGAATRKKLNELCSAPQINSQPLTLTLTTVNQPQLLKVANIIKEYWQTIGVSVQINAVSVTDLKPIIKSRNYDALLYGEALGSQPDLYPFWHSSQKLDPGLNLSSYENKIADQLLKESRETLEATIRQQKLEKLQDVILNDAPAIFLYNPDYVYWVSEKVSGINTEKIIDPAKRFVNVTNWHLKTKRVWK